MGKNNNDWKDRLGVVFSTNSDYNFVTEDDTDEAETLPKNQQRLRVSIEKSGRGGKTVTVVRGFVGTDDDLKALGKFLKTRCGVGGTVKEGTAEVQGQLRDKVIELLRADGYTDTK